MYSLQIVLDGTAFSMGVMPISITNGRNDLDTALTQFYSSATVFRKVIQDTYTTAGKDIRLLGKGSTYQVQMKKTGGASFTTIFDGVVTDTSSTADTITFNATDAALFKIINYSDVTYTFTGTRSAGAIIDDLAEFAGIDCNRLSVAFMSDANFTGTSIATRINEIGQNVPYGIVYARTPAQRATLTELHLRQFTEVDLVTGKYPVSFDLSADDINKDYNLQQSATDIANRITVAKTSGSNQGSATVEDATSIAAVGIRQLDFETVLAGDADRLSLAKNLLSRKTARGWGQFELKTSYDRISDQFTDELDCYEKIIPSNCAELVNITEPFLGQYGFIQQVQHTLSQKYWEISMLMVDERIIRYPQRWNEATANLQWGQIDPAFTWDIARSLDL